MLVKKPSNSVSPSRYLHQSIYSHPSIQGISVLHRKNYWKRTTSKAKQAIINVHPNLHHLDENRGASCLRWDSMLRIRLLKMCRSRIRTHTLATSGGDLDIPDSALRSKSSTPRTNGIGPSISWLRWNSRRRAALAWPALPGQQNKQTQTAEERHEQHAH